MTIQNKRQAIKPNQQEKEREHQNNTLERTFEAINLTLRNYMFRIKMFMCEAQFSNILCGRLENCIC